jgi:large subunit ribosomal protein L20
MRVKAGKARARSKKRLFKEASGYRGGRSKLLRTVKETVVRAQQFAYRDRRNKKRDFRRLWITRITAACRMHGLRYSQFIYGLNASGLGLNRKTLSELAMNEPAVFAEIVEVVKGALNSAKAA